MTGRRPGRTFAVGLGSLAVAVLLPHAAAPAAAEPCETTREAHLVVTSVERRVTLCYAHRAVKSFKVRLARNGLGKMRAGDARLPLGTYKLGVPRDSDEYGLFIPIGYPTARQAAAGYTGDAIGVHGPPRATRWLGFLADGFVKTQGCVGLATDDHMRQVAAFVRTLRVRTVAIR
jgi:L,D-transpeptidase catalytic domain